MAAAGEKTKEEQAEIEVKLKRHRSKLMGDTAVLPMTQRSVIILLEHHYVELALGALIMFNLLLLIFETDARAAGVSPPKWISFMNYMLICIYSVELFLKLFAYRWRFFFDEWNCVDFCVVGSDLVLIGLELLIGGMPKVSVFRMFRLVRLMRAFKALSVFPELAMLLRGFVCAAKAIFWGLLLIVIVITIWSILAVQLIHPLNKEVALMGLYSGCERCPRAFSSVFQSNLTIFQTIIAGDSWGTVALPIIENFPLAGIFFLLVLSTLGIGIMNLILAVIVDSAQGSKNGSPEEQAAQQDRLFQEASRTMTKLCSSLDTDGGGTLTKDELMAGFQMPEFQEQMEVMSLERADIDAIFDVLDDDGSGDVSYNELVQQLHRFRTPDMRTAITEITKLHQKVQNLFVYDREESQKNHTLLLSLLNASGLSGGLTEKLSGLQLEKIELVTHNEQPGAPEAPFDAALRPQQKEEKKRERKEEELQRAALLPVAGLQQGGDMRLPAGFQQAFLQLQGDMRQLLQESAEINRSVLGVRSAFEKHDARLSAEKWDVADMSEMLQSDMSQLLSASAEHHKVLVGVRSYFEDTMFQQLYAGGNPGKQLSITSRPDVRYSGELAPLNSPPFNSAVVQHFPGDLARKFENRADFDAYCAERSRQRRARDTESVAGYSFGEPRLSPEATLRSEHSLLREQTFAGGTDQFISAV